MSYPSVEPADDGEMNPVGTQDSSVGNTKIVELPKEELDKAVGKALDDMFAVSDAWKPRMRVKFKIVCPSGQTALVKHLDTLDLLEHDLIEELDFFTRKLFPISIDLSGNPVDAKEQAEQSIYAALADPEKRKRFFDMTGKLMAAASVKPKIIHDGVVVHTDKEGSKTTRFGYEIKSVDNQVKLLGKPLQPLKDGEVYSGYIEFADRMAFFQELNRPLSSIEPFREKADALLQDLAREQGDGDTSE
jgi:hypothetical protein